jgi:hypothetical protein
MAAPLTPEEDLRGGMELIPDNLGVEATLGAGVFTGVWLGVLFETPAARDGSWPMGVAARKLRLTSAVDMLLSAPLAELDPIGVGAGVVVLEAFISRLGVLEMVLMPLS